MKYGLERYYKLKGVQQYYIKDSLVVRTGYETFVCIRALQTFHDYGYIRVLCGTAWLPSHITCPGPSE